MHPRRDLTGYLNDERERAVAHVLSDHTFGPVTFTLHGSTARAAVVLDLPGPVGPQNTERARAHLTRAGTRLGRTRAVGLLYAATVRARAWAIEAESVEEAAAALAAYPDPEDNPRAREVLVIAACLAQRPDWLALATYDVVRGGGTIDLAATTFPEGIDDRELVLLRDLMAAYLSADVAAHR